MAKYVVAVQNVRADFNPAAVGTADAPVALGRHAVIDAGTAPDAAACQAAIAGLFPDGNPIPSGLGDLFAAGIANATVRADETTGAGSFRHGKAVYQLGVGYHATDDATAIASVNWKNLS